MPTIDAEAQIGLENAGTIYLLRGVPLDPTYDHTLYFNTSQDQEAYFLSMCPEPTIAYSFQRQSYTSPERGKIRVAGRDYRFRQCNYLMIKNESFNQKWYYGFITKVEAISPNVAEITFEIDVMQTYFFDYELEPCFIERQHSETDEVGANTVPEGLEIGDYLIRNKWGTNALYPLVIVVACTFDRNYATTYGGFFQFTYSGLNFITFPNTYQGAQNCAAFLTGAGQKIDGVVSIFLMPERFFKTVGGEVVTIRIPQVSAVRRADGRGVKNNKLRTYPYCGLYVTNNQGNTAVYHYEYFTRPPDQTVDGCYFYLTCDTTPNPTAVLTPVNYKEIVYDTQRGIENYDEKLTLSGFPQLPWVGDTFKAWLAQNASGLSVNALAGVLSVGGGIASAATGSPTGVSHALSGALQVASTIGEVYTHSFMPNQAHGSANGSAMMAVLGVLDFTFYEKTIKPEFASIIDDYFDAYGYATHTVTLPNRSSRPHWNYVRTIGCHIKAYFGSSDVKKICAIYNNGITFWKNPSEVGDYSLDNRPER